MSTNITELVRQASDALHELTELERQYGDERESWPAGQAEHAARVEVRMQRLTEQIERAEAEREEFRAKMRDAVARGNVEGNGRNAGSRRGRDPFSSGAGEDLVRLDSADGLAARARDAVERVGLPDHGAELLTGIVDREAANPRASALVLAGCDPLYRSAFAKVMKEPTRGFLLWTEPEREAFQRVEHLRAAMSLVDGNGGYLAPWTVDPSVVLTNDGSSNAIRQLARTVVATSDVWNGVASAGINAEYLPEGTEAADASPTFSRISATPVKLAAYAFASYEVIQDTDVVSQLPKLFQDSFDRIEASGMATGAGAGSDQLYGIVTAIQATTASRIAATTASAFGLPDLYKVDNAVPTRARQGNIAWLMNRTTINTVRSWDTTGGSAYFANLGEQRPPILLDSPLYESESISAAITTGSVICVLGDWSEFIIAERLGLTVVPVPAVVGDNKRATYQYGWAAYKRVGTTVGDMNRFRALVL